jgi:hypothetical protein
MPPIRSRTFHRTERSTITADPAGITWQLAPERATSIAIALVDAGLGLALEARALLDAAAFTTALRLAAEPDQEGGDA